MNKLLAAGALALAFVACKKADATPSTPPAKAPAAGAPTANQVVGAFDLGQSI